MNYSEVLSLIAIIFSGTTLFYMLWRERRNIDLDINESLLFKSPKKFDHFINITNYSKLPISINKIEVFESKSISKIFFLYKNKESPIFIDLDIVEKIYTAQNSKTKEINSIIYSCTLPINLSPYSSFKDIFRFEYFSSSNQEVINKLLNNKNEILYFKIYTSRGTFWRKLNINNVKIFQEPLEFYNKFYNHKKVTNKNID